MSNIPKMGHLTTPVKNRKNEDPKQKMFQQRFSSEFSIYLLVFYELGPACTRYL